MVADQLLPLIIKTLELIVIPNNRGSIEPAAVHTRLKRIWNMKAQLGKGSGQISIEEVAIFPS